MNIKILTIIVPVYNVDVFLRNCLNSFVGLSEISDLEVLVVNDGSTDGSLEIAKEYASQQPEIFRVITKENGGHGSAVNTGISFAQGKYLKVVDGDDWIDHKELLRLLNYLRENDSDIVATDYCWVDADTGRKKAAPRCAPSGVHYRQIYPFNQLPSTLYLKMHNLTVKTSLFRENCPKLDEHCFYVDNEFMLYPIPFVKTVAFLDCQLYMYRIGLASQSIDIKRMQEREDQHRKVLFRLLAYLRQVRGIENTAATAYIASGIARILVSQFKIYLSFRSSLQYKEKIMQLDSMILNDYPEVYQSVKNKYIKLLRLSRYQLYWLASFSLRLKLGID